MGLRFAVMRLDKHTRTPAGALRVDAAVTSVGVFPYRNPDGSVRREYRSPEEVFKADSVSTLRDAPVTHDHPPGLVTSSNWKKYAVGHQTGELKHDNLAVLTPVVINDAAVIQDIETGRIQEISCGYSCSIDNTPGVTPEGERYDARQTDIRYNHIALGAPGWGRQGAQASLRLDAHDDQIFEKETMKIKIRRDGKEIEVEAGSAEHLQLQAQIDLEINQKIAELTKQVSEISARADAAEAKLKTETARADAAEKFVKNAARTELETRARSVLGKDVKFDGKSDDDVRKLVIAKKAPDMRLDGKDSVYLAAAFDIWCETPKSEAASSAAEKLVNQTEKQDTKEERPLTRDNADSDAARERAIARSRDAWRTKTA